MGAASRTQTIRTAGVEAISLRQIMLRRGLPALLAGAAYPFGFAPFGAWWVTLAALAVLAGLWRNTGNPRAAFWLGYAFGLGQFTLGVGWVYISIHTYGEAPVWLAAGLAALLIAYLALFPAGLGWALVRLRPGAAGVSLGWGWAVSFAALWTLIEWLRGWLLTGFPWLLAGYSSIDTPLAGLAPVLGVLGQSAALAFTAAALATVRWQPRTWLVPAAAAAIWAAAYALKSIVWTQAAGPELSAALVQGDIAQLTKWDPATRTATLARYEALTAAHWNSDVIVWPETAVPMYYHAAQPLFLDRLAARAAQHGADLVLGLPYDDPVADRYYNSLIRLGAETAVYHKRHLVPFGEYVPFTDWLGALLDWLHLPMSGFSAGASDQTLIEVAGYPAGLSICFEAAFGAKLRDDLPAAALLINVSNDAWFGDSWAPHQHLEIARMRALEAGRPLLRATNNGITALIGPQGQIQARSPQFVATTLTGRFTPQAGTTPYARWGDWPILLLAGAAAGMRHARARRTPSRSVPSP